MNKPHILLVEDDVNLAFVIRENLEHKGFSVSHCGNGQEALSLFKQQYFDLCLIDIMLPKLDGFSLAEKIRSTNTQVPLIFLTARELKEDKINGFRIGADDYITKPFNMEELLLRIRVFLKRSQAVPGATTEKTVYQLCSYTFDYLNLDLKHSNSNRAFHSCSFRKDLIQIIGPITFTGVFYAWAMTAYR